MKAVHAPFSRIYVAHRFLEECENLDKVERLVSWLNDNYDCLFYAPWVPAARYSSKHVAWQMRIDFKWIEASAGIFIFNAVGSRGCERERAVALEALGVSCILDFGTLTSIDEITAYHREQLEMHYGKRPV